MPTTAILKKIKIIKVSSFEELSQCYYDYEKANSQPLMNSLVWLTTWYAHYWQTSWQLHSIVIYQNDNIIAIAPFYCQNEKKWHLPTLLYPLGQGEPESAEIASEYLDILISPGYKDVVLKELALCLRLMKVDQIIWRAALSNSHISALITCAFKYNIQQNNTRYLVETKRWSIKELSRNTRSRHKRSLNQFQKYSAKCVWIKPENYKDYYQTLVNFHQIRWQEKGQLGAFFHPNFNAFHQQLLLNNSDSIKMSAILFDGKAIAINYYLSDATTLYFYQCGWDDGQYSKLSPGLALHIWSIDNCNHCYYDFMMGSNQDSYKSKFSNVKMGMVNLKINLNPLRLFAYKVLEKWKLALTK